MTGEEHAVLKLAQRAGAVADRRARHRCAQLPHRDHIVLPSGQLSENVTHWSL